MVAGATHIDHTDMLRAGSSSKVLEHRVMAPSTLGTFLRSFTFGHVRQLEAVIGDSLTRAWQMGAGPKETDLVIDVDSFIHEVHGKKNTVPPMDTPRYLVTIPSMQQGQRLAKSSMLICAKVQLTPSEELSAS